jgi:hypothetical protein
MKFYLKENPAGSSVGQTIFVIRLDLKINKILNSLVVQKFVMKNQHFSSMKFNKRSNAGRMILPQSWQGNLIS